MTKLLNPRLMDSMLDGPAQDFMKDVWVLEQDSHQVIEDRMKQTIADMSARGEISK